MVQLLFMLHHMLRIVKEIACTRGLWQQTIFLFTMKMVVKIFWFTMKMAVKHYEYNFKKLTNLGKVTACSTTDDALQNVLGL